MVKRRETNSYIMPMLWKETDKLVFDHDHKTLEHRGWLCHPCNQGLGLLGDDIQSIRKALTYLETA